MRIKKTKNEAEMNYGQDDKWFVGWKMIYAIR